MKTENSNFMPIAQVKADNYKIGKVDFLTEASLVLSHDIKAEEIFISKDEIVKINDSITREKYLAYLEFISDIFKYKDDLLKKVCAEYNSENKTSFSPAELQKFLSVNIPSLSQIGLLPNIVIQRDDSTDITNCAELKNMLIKHWHYNLLELDLRYPPSEHSSILLEEIKKDYDFSNLNDVIKLIMQSDKENDVKVLLIELFQHEDELFDIFAKMLIPLTKKFEDSSKIFTKDLANNFNLKYIIDNLLPAISNSLHLEVLESIEILIIPQIISANSIGISFQEESNLTLRVGLYSIELKQERDRADRTFKFITEGTKMLSDPTRLKAVLLLKDKSMYLKELADALEISSATMSHHIQHLINNELVSIEIQGKNRRVYYQLNHEVFLQLADEIRKLGETGDI